MLLAFCAGFVLQKNVRVTSTAVALNSVRTTQNLKADSYNLIGMLIRWYQYHCYGNSMQG